jgi:chemotaxis signal transduction protein
VATLPDAPVPTGDYASVSSSAHVSSSPRPAVASFQQAVEVRDTRPFRERVSSRRGTVGLLLFRLGSETFAAELGAVEEAIEVPALHGLPEMQTGMLGMYDLRGKLLPVFSASGVLGVPLTPGSTATLVVRGAGRRIGIAVDDVEDVIDADCATLRNPPGGPDADGVLLAVLQRGTALASVIDAGALVTACLASSPEHA